MSMNKLLAKYCEFRDIWVAAPYFDGTAWKAFTSREGIPDEDLTGVTFVDGQAVAFGTKGNGLLLFSIKR